MRKILAGIALVGTFALGACGSDPTNGKETIGSIDLPFTAAQAKVAQEDVQAAVNALPGICQKFELAVTLTVAELNLIASKTKLPPRTITNISNASSKGSLICDGTAAIVAPLATN